MTPAAIMAQGTLEELFENVYVGVIVNSIPILTTRLVSVGLWMGAGQSVYSGMSGSRYLFQRLLLQLV